MYNENRIISQTARELSSYMQQHFSDYEILFYNDGSTDGCDETVRSLSLPNVFVIAGGENHGKGYAVRQAMLQASGDVRMFLDSDLAYGTDVISRVARTFESDPEADVVIGSRNLEKGGYEGYSAMRTLASKCYLRLLSFAGRFRLSDSQCGCKAFSAKAATDIFSRCEVNGFAFDFEALLWASKLGYKTVELPVRVLRHGDSKVRIVRDSLRMIRDVRAMRKRIGKR